MISRNRYTTDLRTTVCLTEFHATAGAREYTAMVVPDGNRPFAEQLDAVWHAVDALPSRLPAGAVHVFARIFLSDPANQASMLPARPYAVSVVGQAPLGGGVKIAALVLLQHDVTVAEAGGGLYEVKGADGSRDFYAASWTRPGTDSETATVSMLEDYSEALAAHGCTLADNCLRTWFFVRDVDVNYRGVVDGRNTVFDRKGLTASTHFIASTGIGGYGDDHCSKVSFDAYASPDVTPDMVTYLKGASHLNPTSEYGVAFERATLVCRGGCRRVIVSGTASIDNKGLVVHTGDIVGQTARMCENVEVLLAEGGCAPEDMTHAIVYLRDIADAAVVARMIEERYPGLPAIFLLAPVCRPGWLVEMECVALRED